MTPGTIQASGPLPQAAVSPPGLTSRQADFLVAFSLGLLGQVKTIPFKPRWREMTVPENAAYSLLSRELGLENDIQTT